MQRRLFLQQLSALAICCSFPSLLSAESVKKLIFSAQGEVALSAIPQRILSAGRVADVLLMALCPEKLIGVATEMQDPSKQTLPALLRNLAYTGRLAGRGSTIPMEKLIALKPDLIVDVGDVSETYLSIMQKVYQQTQIPYILLAGRLADTPQQLLQLGELLGVSARAKQLAQQVQHILQLTQNILQDKQLKIYMGRGADGLETGLAGSIHSEIIDWLGAQNVAQLPEKKMLARVSMEQLLLWQPNLIITQDKNFFQHLQQDSTWQKLTAVQNNQFYLAPNQPFGWLEGPPSINRLLGCLWLAHHAAPEKLPEPQFLSLSQDFLRQFFGVIA